MRIILEPEYKDGWRRVVDLVLRVRRPAAKTLPEPGVANRIEVAKAETSTTTLDVASPAELRRQLDAEAARRKTAGRRVGPAILLVFADVGLTYGQLVEIRLPVTGTYSDTAPYDCPKTKKLLDWALHVQDS